MTLEAFYKLLAGGAGVTALVDDRIHYGIKPPKESEASIVLQLITESFAKHMRGPANATQGLVRLNCFAASPAGAADLADAVRHHIDGYRGAIDPYFFRFVVVQASSEIPRDVPAGEAGPDVFGIYLDASFMLKT